MLVNRLLILILVSSVTLREDFSFLVASVGHIRSADTWDDADGDQASHDEDEIAVTLEPDSNAPDENDPDDGNLPVILEFEMDFQPEEMLSLGGNKADLGSLGHCLVHENDVFLSTSFNSFCTLTRLRT